MWDEKSMAIAAEDPSFVVYNTKIFLEYQMHRTKSRQIDNSFRIQYNFNLLSRFPPGFV